MKITDLHVDCFGIWRDLDIAELSEQLTVFFGPNEAGKTTLLHFLRSMLYGFSPVAVAAMCLRCRTRTARADCQVPSVDESASRRPRPVSGSSATPVRPTQTASPARCK